MTNRIALALGLLIVVLLALDRSYQDWAGTLFVARKFADMIEWLAFWR